MSTRTDTLALTPFIDDVGAVLDSFADSVLQCIVDGCWPNGAEATDLERVAAARILTKRFGG